MTTSTSVPSWLLRSERRYCRPCGDDVVSKPRLRLAAPALGLTIVLVLVLIGFSALIGPFIMFTAPLILLAGFALGPLASLVSEPPSCPSCHRELVFASRDEAPPRAVRATPVRRLPLASVGDMKAA